MGFDASRPVPWNLLIRRFGFMFVGMVVLVALTSKANFGGLTGGLLFGGLLFFGFSWLLSKFGYAPKSMAQIRDEARTRNDERGVEAPARRRRSRRSTPQPVAATGRPKPPPTRRTASGVGRHPGPRKR